MSRLGRQHTDTPDRLVDALRAYVALEAADQVLVTIPDQLGVDLNAKILTALHDIGTELGWNEEGPTTPVHSATSPIPA